MRARPMLGLPAHSHARSSRASADAMRESDASWIACGPGLGSG
jgi:hypothetical protein